MKYELQKWTELRILCMVHKVVNLLYVHFICMFRIRDWVEENVMFFCQLNMLGQFLYEDFITNIFAQPTAMSYMTTV